MSKVYLIGGVDSFGVPYTRDNKNNINHLEIVSKYLKDKGIENTMIDMYSMNTYNDTDYINTILEQDMDLYQIKENQIESIDLCRKSGIFQYIQLPESTKKLYCLDSSLKNEILSDIIRDNDIIFVYSCGVNDFLKNMNTNLAKLLSPKNMDEAFENIEETIAFVINKIEHNIQRLIELNKNIEIYVLGIYIPTRVGYIRSRVTFPIRLYNKILKEFCKKFPNVHFIDNSNLTKENMAHVDWHPNYTGQKVIGENIISEINNESEIFTKLSKVRHM